MVFLCIGFIYKTALQLASEKGYVDIVKELLACDKIDINIQTISF